MKDAFKKVFRHATVTGIPYKKSASTVNLLTCLINGSANILIDVSMASWSKNLASRAFVFTWLYIELTGTTNC